MHTRRAAGGTSLLDPCAQPSAIPFGNLHLIITVCVSFSMRNGKKLSESALFPAKTLLNGVSEYADDFQAVESSTLQSLKLHLNLARLPLPPGRFLSLPRARCLSALLHFHPRLKLFQSKLNASLFFFFFCFFRKPVSKRLERPTDTLIASLPNPKCQDEVRNL